MKPFLPSSSPSFALISVLALVSLAALTATAFLASARLERQATRSIGSQTQLDMALSSGMECAAQTINIMCEPKWNTAAVYWRGTNPDDWTKEIGYLLLGRPNSINNLRWTYFCGFSPAVFKNIDTNAFLLEGTNIRQDSYLADIGAFMNNMTNGFVTNPSATNTNCTQIPLLGGRTSPPVGWVYIFQPKPIAGTTNTTNTPVARFAYFMEDLQGYIDAERMGGLTNRDTGTNPQEICLTNMLGTNSTNFCNSNNRIKYLSPGMMMYAGGISSSNLAYVATHLLSWTNSPQFVPFGIPVSSTVGYSSAGTNKTNLNTVCTMSNPVPILAGFISSNIPSFASTKRSGAMSSTAYLSNIAANIVDYIDADSDPTVDSANPPAWRGCELIAWPNEIFTRIHLESADTKAEAGGFTYSFKLKHYLEVWNINNSNVPVANLIISNNRSFAVQIPPGGVFDLNTLGTNNSVPLTPVAGSPATLRPGEFGMLETPTITLRKTISGAISITNVQFKDWNQNSSVIYTTGGQEISRTKKGSLTYNKDILASAPYGVGNGVNFSTALSYAVQSTYRAPPPNLKSIGGDPRATMFLGTWPTKGMLYSNYSSPGGLNWENGNKSFSNGYVNAKDLWPDGGRYKSTDLGVNPTSYGTSPEIYYLSRLNTWSTNVGLARVRNGPLSNICELGNIFDPLQWEDSTQLPPAAGGMPGLWTNLSSSAVPSDTAGGRNTLRIGRAEFSCFAFTNYSGSTNLVPNMGLSAAALLDIFCATNNFDTGGRINLNTAPAPVLRALALGINLKSDPALLAGAIETTNHPVPASMAEAFAQGVMRFRSKYPFLTPSQLSFIGTDNSWPANWPNNSVFGNTNIITLTNIPGSLASSANIGVSEWNDQAAEEWFSKIYQLSTVQSFNYRAYVVAQLVGTNLMPKGSMARKYYHLYLRNNSTTNISAGPFMNYQSAY